MDYEGRICTGPTEAAAYKLAVAVGCAYNRCKFCGLFKDLKYRELPMEQIEQDLIRACETGGRPRKVFLGDGNAFGMKTDHLLEIIDLIHKYFPDCGDINMDATVTNIRQKSDAELKTLYNAGVRHLYLGIESGLDDVLTFMLKDHSVEEAYREIARMQAAGLIFDAHIMTGVAGKGRGIENAEATAEFLNRTHPAKIVNFSIFHGERYELWEDIKAGRYTPASELENLEEDLHFLELLDLEGTKYEGFHDVRVNLRVHGTLPKDKEKMMGLLKDAIEKERLYEEQNK